ncbi:efflux RND transporter periplasmic adaptor subunit [Desulfosporosinus hippei]|uniref:HlyD family secretion protein n=1 Tax=Desulfosporosinus hippei DSM 8344 TaxID=1121419 RepID=A0A1G8JTZ3_9FIRM|nr:HlyD family efflux transporter periplasmic adaptor subunit [Desulfosporosinus hippei]SDI34563.1 HlyD family secretion protein [Desulfosporosinus hippei DSM 8344]
MSLQSSPRKSKKKTLVILSTILLLALAGAIAVPRYLNAQNTNKIDPSAGETRTVTVGTQDIRKVISGSGQIVTGDEETLTLDEDKTVDEVLVAVGEAVKTGQALVTYTNGTELDSTCNGVVGTIAISDSSASSTGNGSNSGNAAADDTITIQSTDTLVTQLSVNETDLQNLKIDQAAEITINALTDTTYTGKVSKISETGTYANGSSTFTVTITLDKTENVKIGMSTDVEIVTASVTSAVAVPIEAVSGSGDKAVVTVVKSDGTTSAVSVKLGLANDAYVQITSGVVAGDTIQYTVKTSAASGNAGGFGGFGSGGTGMQGMGENMPERSGNSGNQPSRANQAQ